jgi:exopolysaccharide biosynthesis polyprenyl glycosylphosphotransferase
MKRSEIAISASLVPIDYLMVILAGISAFYIRYWQPVQDIRPVVFDLSFEYYFGMLLLVALVWVGSFMIAGLYSMKGTRRLIDELSSILLASSTAVMVMMFVFFFSRSLFDSRFIILAGWFFSIVLIVVGRGLVRLFQHFLYNYGIGVHRVVVIGDTEVAKESIEKFSKDIKSGFRVVKHFGNLDKQTFIDLTKMATEDKFDEILVATPDLTSKERNELNDFSYVNHIVLKYVADIFEFPVNNFEINTISGLPIIEVKKTRLDGWGRVTKRIFDIVVSAILIIILSPVMLLVVLAIKIDSRGTILFKYKRIGRLGKPFTYFKFRSMIKDAHKYRFDKKFLKEHKNEREGTPMIKFVDDPRITKVGRVIRKFSLDELPELFNVFIGRMSLVGPRPHEVEEVRKYATHHKKVLTISPGMTGMAQVSGRSDLDFEEEIRLDIWYMENWRLKLDLMILLKTPLAVLKKRKTE